MPNSLTLASVAEDGALQNLSCQSRKNTASTRIAEEIGSNRCHATTWGCDNGSSQEWHSDAECGSGTLTSVTTLTSE